MRGVLRGLSLFNALLLSVCALPLTPSGPAIAIAADTAKSAMAVKEFEAALAKESSIEKISEEEFAKVPLTKADAEQACELLWKRHAAIIAKDRAAEVKEGRLKDGTLEMPFFIKKFGEAPESGRSLWISLHGGGGAPKEVNDSQWENQKRLYGLAEGIYLVPRAPTNTWNLWHEGHIDRMFDRLIEDLVVLENVDSDRVYVLGYSAGGDGVYQLAPRMADRWAAAAMMAGHPNDASPLNLRNLGFALQVGGRDAAYGRNKVAREFGEQIEKLHKEDAGGYPHFVKIHEEKGHWMDREDALALPWMAKLRRNPTPDVVVWKQDDVAHDRLYWLAVPPEQAKGGTLVVAERKEQAIDIKKAEGIGDLKIRLDERFVDLDKPVRVTRADKTLFEGVVSRTIATLSHTLAGRGDPKLIFAAEVIVKLGEK